jgi:hypothetical protein
VKAEKPKKIVFKKPSIKVKPIITQAQKRGKVTKKNGLTAITKRLKTSPVTLISHKRQ